MGCKKLTYWSKAEILENRDSDFKTTPFLGVWKNPEHEKNVGNEYIHTSEGRIRFSGDSAIYDYYLKDHLGNTRVVFTDNGTDTPEVQQVSNYYPFGMRFGETNQIGNETTDYMYNGKEFQDELGWYDYGWRMYDPAIGRFMKQDRFAEKYHTMSPYQYAANNPILFIDENGNTTLVATDKEGEGMSDKAQKFYDTMSDVIESKSTTSVNIVDGDEDVIIGDQRTALLIWEIWKA